ncbi:MAG: hypothetical protein WA086_01245 [Ideonella sp.]
MSASSPADRLLQAELQYADKFSADPPVPFGVSDAWLAEVLEGAISAGAPVPSDFDWYPDMPEGAVA